MTNETGFNDHLNIIDDIRRIFINCHSIGFR